MALKGNRFTLTISSWRGQDPTAQHFYGRIRSKVYGEVDLERRYPTCHTIKFETEAEVIAEAKRWFFKHGRLGDVLVLPGIGEILFERCSDAQTNNSKKTIDVSSSAPATDQKRVWHEQEKTQRRV